MFLPEEFHGQRSLAGYHPRYQRVRQNQETEHAHMPAIIARKGKKKNTKLQRCAKKVNHLTTPFLTLVMTEVEMTGVSSFLHLLPGSHKDTHSTVRSFQIIFTNVGLHEAPHSETYLIHQ